MPRPGSEKQYGAPSYTAHFEETVRLCRLFGWIRGRDAECEGAGLGLVA
jgi:hypothetical protein